MSDVELPLFPLNTVLFPGGPLPLRIFEARYVDMVGDCLRNDRGFGVCLIREGTEAGPAASTFEVGTVARIADWTRLEDGLLGVTAVGGQRFRLMEREVRPDQLVMGRVALLEPEPSGGLPPERAALAGLLRELTSRLHTLYAPLPAHYDDSSWVGYRLAELLPLPLARKQQLLELEDPLLRLSQLDGILRSFAEKGA